MTQKNSIILAFCVLGIALMAAGLWVAGGPATGRAEQRDEERMADLVELHHLTYCLAETAEGVLPDQIDMSETCQRDAALNDPFTGEAYEYQKISERAYKWCANFELPDRVRDYWSDGFDPETGCLQFTYRP